MVTDVDVWCSASETDSSKHPTTSGGSTGGIAVSQYSAKPQMYSMPTTASMGLGVPDTVQSAAGYAADPTQPYVQQQQLVQHVVAAEPTGPATAVYQPTPPLDTVTYRQDGSAYHTAAPSTLLLQQETNAPPTHFVVPTPAAPSMSAPAFGPPLPQFVVGQPGAVRPMESFAAQPPPPPGSVPYPAMPCVSGINTGNAAVSYWMTLH